MSLGGFLVGQLPNSRSNANIPLQGVTTYSLIFWLNIIKVYDEGFLAEVTVVDFIAEVTLIQSFENSEDDPIEAVYVW